MTERGKERVLPNIEWEDGYPTSDSIALVLNAITAMKCVPNMGKLGTWLSDTLEICAENCCAKYSECEATDFLGRQVKRIEFSTSGWSGAEEIVDLIEGYFWLKQFMVQWRRGGHYIFEIPARYDSGAMPEQAAKIVGGKDE